MPRLRLAAALHFEGSIMRALLLPLLLAFVAGGCETDVATVAEDAPRGPTGKAELPGTCEAACGGRSDDGCWCDDLCTRYGDCCADKAAVCDAPPPPPGSCDKNVVLMGYWPPTNEMLRPWSTNELQNPNGWQGKNWRGHGYDVYAFFPEFPPDGDPTNDAIGDDGAVGSPDFDLRVDYQATSADFWRIVDEVDPIILITTSRGGQIGWEIEAIEGGHGVGNSGDPSGDWRSDDHGSLLFPTQQSVDPRSWDAISEFRRGNTFPSALPLEAIFETTKALDLTTVAIDERGTSGNFLSGFLGLHGIYYNLQTERNVAAGHIHVGFGLPTATARQLIEATLETVLLEHPAADQACPPD